MLLRERPLKGLLGGMLEMPSSPWTEARAAEPCSASMRRLMRNGGKFRVWSSTPSPISIWSLTVYRAEVERDAELKRAAQPERCHWLKLRDLGTARRCRR